MSNGDLASITELPDLEYVYSLIQALYNSKENDKGQIASKKLTQIQNSIFGWKIADQLLINGRDYESCYLAAQTLKTKTIHNFMELPKESHASLKDSLINHIIKIDDKVILTQLCLSISHVFFSYLDWEQPIEEIARALPPEKFTQVLIYIGQEFNANRTDNMPFSRNTQLKKLLSHYFLNVYDLVKNNLDIPDHEKVINYFICLENWCGFASKEHLPQIREFVNNIFIFLKNPNLNSELHGRVTDALIRIIFMIEGDSLFPELLSEIFDGVVKLEPNFDYAVKNEDHTKIMNFCKIFCELAISTLLYIVNDQVDLKILDILIKCTDYHEFDVAELTFNFWSEFSIKVFKMNLNQFNLYYFKLLNSLTKHALLEEDLQHDDVIDENSDEYYYRRQIPEIIEEMIACCNWVEYFHHEQILLRIRQTNEWNKFESHIFVITAILAEECSLHNEGKNEVLPEVVNFILQLLNNQQMAHAQVLATSCDLLAELRHWINENSNFLEPVIQFLLTIIQSSFKTVPQLTSRACKPLKLIFKKMEKYSDFESMKSLFSCLENCYIQAEDMKSTLSVSLMSVMTAIISNPNFSNFDQQEDFVERVIQLFLMKMNVIMNTKDPNSVDQKEWQMIIDNIYAMFKGFVPNEKTKKSEKIHMLLQNHIWPFLRLSIQYFNNVDLQVIEHCSRCLRHIIRSMRPSYLLKPIIDQIVPLYQNNPQNSPLLYVGAVLVSEFATENDLTLAECLLQMLNAFSAATFHLFTQSNYQDYPDTVSDFFNLSSKMLIHLTEYFLSNTDTLNGILNLALVAVNLISNEANEARSKFLVSFMTTSHPIVDQYLRADFGQRFIFSTINSLLFVLPSHFAPDLIETLWKYKSMEPQCFSGNFRLCVNQLMIKAETEGYNIKRENFEEFFNIMVNANNPKRMITQCRNMQKFFKS